MSDTIYTKVKLGDLGYTYPGLSGKSKDDFGSGKPYIPYMNIFTNSKIKKTFLEYVDIKPTDRQNKVQKGDLFFTTSSETVEEVGMTSVLLDDIGEAYLNSFCFGFRLHNFETLLPEFAAYLFRSEEVRKKISLFGQGSTRYNLPKTQLFNKLYLNIPERGQQIKIYEILTTCDTVIEQTQSAIAKYKAIKQGMLHDLFTRGLDTNGKLRPTYQQAPELYKNSDLGMIPKEWEVKRLGEITFINPKSKELPEEFIYIDLESVESGMLMKENIVKKKEAPSRAQRLVLKSDILYQMVRPYQKNNLYFTNDNSPICYVASTGYAQLRAFESSDYLYYQLHTDFFVNSVLCKCTGSNYPAINSSELASINVLKPLFVEQKNIALKLKSIDNKLQTEETLLSKYQSIKRGLMGDLLSGKKEV